MTEYILKLMKIASDKNIKIDIGIVNYYVKVRITRLDSDVCTDTYFSIDELERNNVDIIDRISNIIDEVTKHGKK